MGFNDPFWLLLVIPASAALWAWRLPSPTAHCLRVATALLLLLALAGLTARLPSRAGVVVAVIDRSLSMPADAGAEQREAIARLHAARGPENQLAVIGFARSAVVEQPPGDEPFPGFQIDVDGDASSLSEALDTALALIPDDRAGRLLLVSDGRWTGAPPVDSARRAGQRRHPVAIDYRLMQRPASRDLAVTRVAAPAQARPGDALVLHAWVQAPRPMKIAYTLQRGGAVIRRGEQTVAAGATRLTFRDRAAADGVMNYAVTVAEAGAEANADPAPENNRARVLVGVAGQRPALVAASSPNSALPKLLAQHGVATAPAPTQPSEWTLERLAAASTVVLENVSAQTLGQRGMENLAAWIDLGGGLLITGGGQSFGPGGYYRSPLEPVLPVSMELRREHRKLSVAIAIVMDRSGSMAAPVAGGKTKMDLANRAAVEVLDLLSAMDELAVIAVDSAPHVIAPLQPIDKARSARGKILAVESGGGGIFVYEALKAAVRELAKAQAGGKHILLFSDAADSEEPGEYQSLIEKLRKGGVTVSVVGLGTPTDVDADLLRDIAKRGDGRIYFTESAAELPRLFAQDTFMVARSSFLTDPTPVEPSAGLLPIIGSIPPTPPPLGGYNLCYLRPNASLGMVTRDEYAAPAIAAWNAGLGRVVCYTGEADGKYTGPIGGWKEYGALLASLARWTQGNDQQLGAGMMVTQETRDGALHVRLELDPEQAEQGPAGIPTVAVLRGDDGGAPSVERLAMAWSSADAMTLTVPLRGDETAVASVQVPGAGGGRVVLPPVCLPYSPEFQPVASDAGAAALAELARITGGIERGNLGAIWDELPPTHRHQSLTPWLLLAAVVLLVLEVLERRTGLVRRALPTLAWRRQARVTPRKAPVTVESASPPALAATPVTRKPSAAPIAPTSETSISPTVAPPAAPAAPTGDLLSAIRQARGRAKARSDRTTE